MTARKTLPISVGDGPQKEIVRTIRTVVGTCDVCWWRSPAMETYREAHREVLAHLQKHPEIWPTHDDGTPCFHTNDDCLEHGSCIDCDMCKRLCECNW